MPQSLEDSIPRQMTGGEIRQLLAYLESFSRGIREMHETLIAAIDNKGLTNSADSARRKK
jgi:hypothetical protein